MSEATILKEPKVTFNIYKGEGKDVPDTFIHSFLEIFYYSISEMPVEIKSADGLVYKVVLDELFIPEDQANKKSIKVIGSFQKHTFGNFVVIRVFRDKKF